MAGCGYRSPPMACFDMQGLQERRALTVLLAIVPQDHIPTVVHSLIPCFNSTIVMKHADPIEIYHNKFENGPRFVH